MQTKIQRLVYVKCILVLFLFSIATKSNAQVTIGSVKQPVKGALLMLDDGTINEHNSHVNSQKGLMLPRVELIQLKPATTAELAKSIGTQGAWNMQDHIGLIVYNVGASNPDDVCAPPTTPGPYAWDGTEWIFIGVKEEIEGIISTDQYKGSNSYIVTPNTTVEIPVERAFAIWEAYSAATPEEINIEAGKVLDPNYIIGFTTAPLSISIFWQEGENADITSDVISNTSLIGAGRAATMSITAGNNKGNALIQLQNDLNETLWQWHIWVTDDAPTSNEVWQYASTGNNPQCNRFMDRNLGAITKGGPGVEEGKIRPSHGLYYQWGRPTPIRTYASYHNTNDFTTNTTEKANLTSALTTHKFIRIGSSSHDWYFSPSTSILQNYWRERWGDSPNTGSNKSPFDPCPEGWRVPLWKNDESPWSGITANNSQNAIGGRYMEVKDNVPVPNSWTPATGYRTYTNGGLSSVGANGYIWSASLNKTNKAHYTSFTSTSVNTIVDNFSAFAFSVRCVKEMPY